MSYVQDRHSGLENHVAILQSFQQPVLVCAENNDIVWSNHAAESFFGVSSANMSRQKIKDLIAFASPTLDLLETARARQLPMTEHRIAISAPRGSPERITDIYISPLAESGGRISILFQERTTAEKIDRQLVSRDAVRSATGLAAMLAHEIKNPLSGIRGAAQLLEQTVNGEEIALARLIRQETDRIVKLVDRIEVFGDARPLQRQSVNIHAVLDRVKLLAANGIAKNIRLTEVYDPSLPPVMGNADQLIQVFINLLKNAAEALDNIAQPQIKISTSFQTGVKIGFAGNDERISLPLEIIVQDNGPGITGDLLPILFDPFVTTKPNGRGLGLALAAKTISDHGGIIECQSEPGNTRFRILLPVTTHDDDSSEGAMINKPATRKRVQSA